ncbi:MAG: ATP synthase F1 subunit gamma [Balneolaceae bacterium]|nr:MAG: ATP synthase F1 subunit gamma [Balneolaceae bacterium]
MANLRDIRNRINSIKNTQQITKAMKMVAAAKLRKAQQRMTATRPYSKKLREVVSKLVNVEEVSNILLRQPDEVSKILMIIVGSDRGLCGGFNNNLFRVVENTIEDKYSETKKSENLHLIAIGKKAEAYFKKRRYQVIKSYPGFFDDLNYTQCSDIMDWASGNFADGTYDKILIAFNEFKTVISQNRLVEEVLPIQTEAFDDKGQNSAKIETDYIFEPDADTILDDILPVYVNMQLWRAVLESNASEQGARMAAMDNATENAKELEQELRLKYNQARQSAITTEISEIVSGAAALED